MNYNFIIEQTSVVSPKDITILEEGKTPEGKSKIVFRSRLQESDVRNINNRIYTKPVCESIVSQLSPKAKNRSMLMEVDHPMFGLSPDQLKRRASVVEIKNCGAVCRDIKYENGQIIGEVVTLSGFCIKAPIH